MPPASGLIQVRHSFDIGGSTTAEIVHWLNTGEPALPPVHLGDLATDLAGIFQTTLLHLMNTAALFTRTSVYAYTDVGDYSAEQSFSHAGTVSGQMLPCNVAAVVSWDISHAYRGGKPRSYLGGISNASLLSQAEWSDDFVAAGVSAAANYLADVNAITTADYSSINMVCTHRIVSGIIQDPWLFEPIIGAAFQQRICSQRRRLGGLLSE